MMKNAMRPVHPGEVLREEFLVPIGMSANSLAQALSVTTTRINDIVRERRWRPKQTTRMYGPVEFEATIVTNGNVATVRSFHG